MFYLLNSIVLALFLSLTCGCSNADKSESIGNDHAEAAGESMGMEEITLKSSAFAAKEAIPVEYTCDGEDLSPDLSWSGVPEDVESFALICDDPDAPKKKWAHWVIYNIPATQRALSKGIDAIPELESGVRQGRNDFDNIGYGGPCPPPGNPHRYFFKLYALDAKLDLQPGASKLDLLKAMKGHVLARGQLIGTYKR